jgi:cell division protein FtsL
LFTMVCCGFVLATGFIYAARQHFSAVDIGYQSEALRRERAQLLEEQSRLLIARERAATPARLESSARSLGMQPASPAQIGFAHLENQERASDKEAHLVPALAVSAARLGSR